MYICIVGNINILRVLVKGCILYLVIARNSWIAKGNSCCIGILQKKLALWACELISSHVANSLKKSIACLASRSYTVLGTCMPIRCVL